MVEVRNAEGGAAAIGTTITIAKVGLKARAEGFGDQLRVPVEARNEGGIYDVQVTKPWYMSASITGVHVPADACGVLEPTIVQAIISLRDDAPEVRQVVLPPYDYGFGAPVCGGRFQVPAYVLTGEATSRRITWVSRNPNLVTVEPGEPAEDGSEVGWITPQCDSRGMTYVVGMAEADPTVRDSIGVLTTF